MPLPNSNKATRHVAEMSQPLQLFIMWCSNHLRKAATLHPEKPFVSQVLQYYIFAMMKNCLLHYGGHGG